MAQTVADLGEWGIIRELLRGLPTHDIGDDATVVRTPHKNQLISTDLLQAGVHFDPRWAPWEQVGYKALQVNLSDIAAMGGRPSLFWLALSLPPRFAVADLKQLRRGLSRAARESGVRCAGGDTSQGQHGVTLALTMLGAAGARVIRRRGARVGDAIFVTGRLGEAALGLELLKKRKGRLQGAQHFCKRQTRPQARVAMGQRLAALGIHAMIDVSDGLLADLAHILEASGVGARIELSALRPSPAFRQQCERLRLHWSDLVLAGGDDYELLFCAPARLATKLQALSRRLKLPITSIGTIVTGRQLNCYDEQGKKMRLGKLGYAHFA